MRQLKKELWPVKISLPQTEDNTKIYEIETWLGEHMGQFKNKWNCVYQYNATDFYFRTGEDATYFSLRWL